MSIKITDLIKQAEDELLEEIEEMDIDRECIERIKRRTMEKIKEAPSSKATSRRIKGSFKLRKMKKGLIIAAILGALIGIGVGAISISPTLQEFFSKQLNLVLPHAQEIQKSINDNGVTMTVDTAVAGNSGGLIILRITKDDGTTFEEGSEFRDFKVSIEGVRSSSYGHGWKLSEDRKVLTYMINLKAIGDIVDTPIEVSGKDIVRVIQHEEMLPINLAEVKPAREQELYTTTEIISDKGGLKGISLEHPYSDVVLGSVGFQNEKFYLYMEHKETEGSLWQLYKLVDMRTGQTLYSDSSEGHAESQSQIETQKVFYKGLTPEDLPYIKIVKLYNTYETFVEGEWKINFTLEPNKNIKTFKGKRSIPLKGEKYEVNNIEISAMGGSIEGYKFIEDTSVIRNGTPDLYIKLYLKDGEVVVMNSIMSSSGDDGENREYCNIYIEAGEDWDSFTPEEKEKRRQEANENMYKRTGGEGYFLEVPFIDIEQVESIEIEGVIFPLK